MHRLFRGASRYARAFAWSGTAAALVLPQLSCTAQGQHAVEGQAAFADPATRAPTAGFRAAAADTAAVLAAVLDYADAIYRSQPERIRRSVDPSLTKLGHARRDGSEDYVLLPMSYARLLEVARTWNEDGEVDPGRARRQVIVNDLFDRTASATLVAEWGVDLLQLHRVDGHWRIIHVLWQTHSEATRRGAGREPR